METAHGESSRHDFDDILGDRRGTSDLVWASRKWTPTVAYDQPVRLSGDNIKSIVLNSPYLKYAIDKIHHKWQVPRDKLYNNARDILDEIGYYRELTAIRWLAVFIAKCLKKLYSSIYVNKTKFLEIKSQFGSNPVLFVPSHKSYCDFILMAYICFHYDIEIPRIAAGMDFQSMALIGNLLRNACAFFIRRSFHKDELYSTVFSQFVQTLVTHGYAGVEFFIEGTRSRTSKSLVPKYGFLTMALKPFFTGQVPDVTIVPVNLSYDRVLEEVLFAYELLGVPKPKESTKGFLKALSILKENYGNVYVKFGSPISVKDYFGDRIDRSVHGFGPVHAQELSDNETKQITHLAHTIVTRQRELTVVTCFNLMALILNDNVMTRHEPLDVDRLVDEVKWLLDVFKVLIHEPSGLAVNNVTREVILHHLSLHKPLIAVSSDERVQLGRIYTRNTKIDQTTLKGHALSHVTLDVAIPLVMLQNYVNPAVYFLVGTCFLALILRSFSGNGPVSKAHVLREFRFLSTIFSYEFVLHGDFINEHFENAVIQGQKLGIVSVQDDHVSKGENDKLHRFAINLLGPFVPGYIAVTEHFLQLAHEGLTEQDTLKSCQQRIESQLVGRDAVVHPCSLSLDALKNALMALVSIGAVSRVNDGHVVRYARNSLDQLESVHSKLKSYIAGATSHGNILDQFSNFVKSNL